MDSLPDWLTQALENLGAAEEFSFLVDLGIFAALVAAGVLILLTIKRIAGGTVRRLHLLDDQKRQTSIVIKTLLDRLYWFTPLAISGLVALAIYHPLSPRLETTLRVTCLVLIFFQIGIWATALLGLWLEKGIRLFNVTEEAAGSATGVVRFFGLVVIWSILLLTMLGNMGIQIGPLLAGLGVGGIAIAFALQKILGDVFCSVAIILDKPFEIGDFIIVDPANLGTVERIGIKTTRVRSLTGEEIIFSNADLLDSRLHNFKRMSERRIVFNFGVTYQTPVEVLEQIPSRVQKIVEDNTNTRFDRGHMKAFGPSSYDFEIVYYVLSREFNIYMDAQQQINFSIIRLLKELEVEFAYPTQTLHVETLPEIVPPPERVPEVESREG